MDSPVSVDDSSEIPRPANDGEAGSGGSEIRAATLAAREDERSRLAAELHDGPAQALSNMVMQVEIVSRELARDRRAAEAELASLKRAMQRELNALRSYINELRPSLLEPVGLETALRDSAAELSSRTGIAVDLRLDAPPAVLDHAERAVVIRVAQEALRNVGKHASAKRAWVTTEYAEGDRRSGGDWVLEVGDNGRSFDVSEVRDRSSRHFGLRFMRERSELVGARLVIDAKPSAGTVVRLSIKKGSERA